MNIVFNLIADKYEEVFNSFYIPADYEEKNLKNDKEAIKKGLEFIIEKLGNIKNFSIVNTIEEDVINLSLNPGPFEEIKNLKSYFSFYKVNFEKFGNAYLSLEFIEKKEKHLLKKIIFLLPTKNSKSLSVCMEIQRFFINFVYKQN